MEFSICGLTPPLTYGKSATFFTSLKWFLGNSKTFLFFPLKRPKILRRNLVSCRNIWMEKWPPPPPYGKFHMFFADNFWKILKSHQVVVGVPENIASDLFLSEFEVKDRIWTRTKSLKLLFSKRYKRMISRQTDFKMIGGCVWNPKSDVLFCFLT